MKKTIIADGLGMHFSMHRERDIPVIFENGIFRPQEPVNIPEGTRGVTHVTDARYRAVLDERIKALEHLRQIREAGAFNSGGLKMTRDQMHERD